MKNKRKRLHLLLITCAAVMGGVPLASAQPTPYPQLARDLAATCSTCHGTGGVSAGEVPSLAGQARDELVRKMQAFKAGSATGTIMPQLAKGYTDQQIELLGGWFATQKPGFK